MGTCRRGDLLSAGAALMAAVFTASASAAIQPSAFNIVKPSTTGVPGEEVRVMTYDSQGNLWIAGRWPFWSESALAMLSVDQLPFAQLPGGGFDTGAWQVWSSVHHPIPSPYIFDLEIQDDGVIWIASEGGLTRFDRNASSPQQMWQTYTTANAPLIMNSVRSIDMDAQGNVWLVNAHVQSSNGALYRFNPAANQWTQYMVGQQLPWEPPWYNLNAVHVGGSGKVYVTHTVLGGFAEFNGTTWTYRPGSVQLGGILEDLQANVWFTSSQSGLIKWNGSSLQSFNLGSQGTVTALGMDPISGLVYAGAWYGDIFKIINGTSAQFFVNADNIPGSIHPRPNGDVWINNYGGNGTLGTVRQYNQQGALLRRMNSFNSGLPWYFMDNIEKDRDGNLWFSCGEGGLSRMEGSDGAPDSPTHWRNWGNHNDNSEPYPFAGNEPMYSMYHHPDGTIYMGGNGVAQWDPKSGTFLNFWNWQNSSLGVDSFIDIEQDGNGDLWIASDYTGLYRLNPATNNWEQKLFGAAFTTANYIQDMERDHNGNLWVATYTSLHMFNGTTWFAITIFHGSPVVGPRCLEVHPDGSLWIGASNGLIKYQDAVWTVYDTSNAPIPSHNVQAMDIRDDGLIAISVMDFGPVTPFPSGVVLFDGANWDVFSYGTHPLPHYQLSDVEFDADGDVWVSTVSEGVVEIVIAPTTVPGDVTGDGLVNVQDLLAVIAAWGNCPGAGLCLADLNGDGTVSVLDLLIVLNNWS